MMLWVFFPVAKMPFIIIIIIIGIIAINDTRDFFKKLGLCYFVCFRRLFIPIFRVNNFIYIALYYYWIFVNKII